MKSPSFETSTPFAHPQSHCIMTDTHSLSHTHSFCSQWGIHHMVLPAVLETPPGRDCFGRVEVYGDRLELIGEDTMMR